jgi:alpha-D-xyloside xylohydrolase
MRYHGTSKREPYRYPAIAGTLRRWFRLRYALIPYLVEQSDEITKTGYPMVRALIFGNPEDKTVWNIDDEYNFGDDFLVAPMMNSQNHRDIYMPEGMWVNFFNGEITEGPCWLKGFECPLEEMPVWVKFGASVPFYPEVVDCTDNMDKEKVIRITFDETFNGIKNSLNIFND